MAPKLNFKIDQGSTFYKTLTFKNALGAPIDLTGDTFVGDIRTKIGAPTVTDNFAISIVDAVAGTAEIEMTDDQTRDLVPGTVYVYDIERTQLTGRVTRILQGNIKVSAEVTR